MARIDELLEPKPAIFIRVNQAGYQPGQPKLAIAFSQSPLPESFSLMSCSPTESSGSAADRVPCQQVPKTDGSQIRCVYQMMKRVKNPPT